MTRIYILISLFFIGFSAEATTEYTEYYKNSVATYSYDKSSFKVDKFINVAILVDYNKPQITEGQKIYNSKIEECIIFCPLKTALVNKKYYKSDGRGFGEVVAVDGKSNWNRIESPEFSKLFDALNYLCPSPSQIQAIRETERAKRKRASRSSTSSDISN